ncbi:ATP-binding cassette domain-containing protein [Psychromonas sp. KJ10-2]|uniref:ATP-binding cassette domain-containing protein n=1 Tax=Psychromonas sp. KJ10-2 TaxID=3391822 RepID=UPI0039B4CABE
MGPAIVLDDVSLRYENNIILEKVSATLGAGQCHVVMGPNGGGKTSLLRSILGLTLLKAIFNFNGNKAKARSVMYRKKPLLSQAYR